MAEAVGTLMVQDYSEILSRTVVAANSGDHDAQFRLGVLNGLGLGCAQDYVKAVKWYVLAANSGHAEAQSNLGYMYGTGRGVPQDYVQAHVWYSLAAAQGDEVARANRDIIQDAMAGDQLERAQTLAAEVFEKLQTRASQQNSNL